MENHDCDYTAGPFDVYFMSMWLDIHEMRLRITRCERNKSSNVEVIIIASNVIINLFSISRLITFPTLYKII